MPQKDNSPALGKCPQCQSEDLELIPEIPLPDNPLSRILKPILRKLPSGNRPPSRGHYRIKCRKCGHESMLLAG